MTTDSKSTPEIPVPAVEHLLPLGSENRWTDLLATLVATDPSPITRMLNLHFDGQRVRVSREITVGLKDRPDLVLTLDDRPVAVIEVKVLAGLGPRQLERYRDAHPNADVYALLSPSRLMVSPPTGSGWRELTWEQVLGTYQESQHDWVRTTARAWSEHLERTMPVITGHTVWDDVPQGSEDLHAQEQLRAFIVAMRARMSWLYSACPAPPGIEQDLVGSSSGVTWVLRYMAPTSRPEYKVVAEFEERLPNREFPKAAAGEDGKRPQGLSAKVVLMQTGVSTSRNFDWDWLHALWPHMDQARDDWVTAAARPRAAHDKAGIARIRGAGAPAHVGIGFGEAQAAKGDACMFGARVQFDPHNTLGDLAEEVPRLVALIADLAQVLPPESLSKE